MNKSRILIVGGSGFLGQHLITSLLKYGHEITVIDRSPSSKLQNLLIDRIRYITADYGDQLLLSSLLGEIDIVFHLASTTVPHTSNMDPFSDAVDNFIPTLKLIELSAHYKIKKFIFYSSGGTVYGESKHELIHESSITNPICSYGVHKLAIEKHLFLFNKLYDLNYLILRIANPFGSGQNTNNSHGIIGTFLNDIIKYSTINVIGDGGIVRDYIHVDDLNTAISSLLEYNGKERIFNIGTGIGTSINEIVDIYKRHSNIPFTINYLNKRNADTERNVLDISRLKSETGWRPLHSLDSYIKSNFYN